MAFPKTNKEIRLHIFDDTNNNFRQTVNTDLSNQWLKWMSYTRVFFKENARYPVWICGDPISLILRTRFSLI